MLTYDADSMESEHVDEEGAGLIPAAVAPSSFTIRAVVRPLLIVLGIGLMVLGILSARGVGPFADKPGPTPASVPVSAEFEDVYGIRVSSVDITAAGGMIQIRYQVLDGDKAEALHSAETAPMIVGADGQQYADPGMAGHAHVGKVSGSGASDSLLLANRGGGLHVGDVVTVRIGDVELHGVPVD
jgi:hypothetical protein